MRYTLAIALVLSMVGLAAASSFAAEPSGEPEYVGVIAARNPTAHGYVQLERLTPTPGHELHAFGFGGGRTFFVYPGEKSPVRFKEGTPLEFVLRVERQDKDPATLIQFWNLVVQDGNRILPLESASSFFSVTATNDTVGHRVPFDAKKSGSTFFVFASSQPLPPGEYSVSTTDDRDGFNFGIDP